MVDTIGSGYGWMGMVTSYVDGEEGCVFCL